MSYSRRSRDRSRDRSRRDRSRSRDRSRDRGRRSRRDRSRSRDRSRRDRDRGRRDDRRGGYNNGYNNGPPPRAHSPEMSRRDFEDEVVEPGSEDEKMELTNDDIAFVLGRGGATKRKLARVSNTDLRVTERNLCLEIIGKREDRKKAREYVNLVLAQRIGPVHMPLEKKRPDLLLMDVPCTCIGYVTGKKGSVLRNLEEEWGTLMFFVRDESQRGEPASPRRGRDADPKKMKKLAIFGNKKGRIGAMLKVLSAVEHKQEGFVLDEDLGLNFDPLECDADETDEDMGWKCDTLKMKSDDFSYALGRNGSTRKKLARASGCIIQYIGRVAFLAGTINERKRARDYLSWLIDQRVKPVTVDDCEERDDCTVIKVPRECVGFITGYKGQSLRSIEKKSETFCFADGDKDDNSKNERLLVFSYSRKNREQAATIIQDMIKMKMEGSRRRSRSRSRSRGRRGRSGSRSRSRGRRR